MRPHHPPRPRPSRTVAALATTALCLATAACETTEPAESTEAAASQEASPTDGSPSPSPSEGPTEATSSDAEPTAEPTEEPTAEAEPPASPSDSPTTTVNARFPDRLLAAEQMPGFNEEWNWQEGGTRRREGRRPFATCHKFAMTTIGAWRVVVRDYTVGNPGEAGDGSTASHLVAEFADRQTARRTFEVLRTWRGQCPEELEEYDRVKVSPLRPVDGAGGEAGWYLLTYGPPEGGGDEEAYFDAQGLTLVGKRISVLQMRTVGQDYNYPAGEEPMVEAVRTAAAELG